MKWLVLTENQEKAAAFRKSLPETLCLSTRGMLWEPSVEISGNTLTYKKHLKKESEDILQKILAQAQKADLILLGFEQTRLGEAIAWELECHIGKEKCCRWNQTCLDRKTIQNFFLQMETCSPFKMPKCSAFLAKPYWCQSALDITWTNKTSAWLKKQYNLQEKITPSQLAILHYLNEEHQKKETYKRQKYYEIHLTLSTKRGEKIHAAPTNPTNLALEDLPQETRRIWKAKMAALPTQLLTGVNIPQPPWPQPYRYAQENAALKYKHHIAKYPFFLVYQRWDGTSSTHQTEPFTYLSLLEHAHDEGHTNQQANQKALQELYHEGYISYYKTENPHLQPQSFNKLEEYALKKGIPIQKSNLGQANPHQEGIHPCDWDKTTKDLEVLLPENELKRTKIWLFATIRNQCLNAYKPPTPPENLVKLGGPLPVSKTASKKTGTPIQVKKEKKLTAPMALIAVGKTTAPIKEGDILETIEFKVLPRETPAFIPKTKEKLFTLISREGKIKPETLEIALAHLLQKGLVDSRPLQITNKGKNLYQEMLKPTSIFLEKEFQKNTHEQLERIETGEIDEKEVLTEWWELLKTLLE